MKILEEQKEGTKIFTIEGRLDSTTTGVVEERIISSIQNGSDSFILDLKALDYISSAGVRAFIHFYQRLKKENRVLILVGVPKKIQHVLQLTGFFPLFTLVENISDALELVKIK